MSANTGTIKIALQIDDKGAVKVLNSVGAASSDSGRKGKRAFEDMSSGAGSFAKNAQQAHTHLLKIGAVLTGGYGVARIGSDFLKTSRDFERFTIQLETITGTSQKAKASMDWIAEFAKTTPYELDQVTDAFVKLEAYGLSGTRWMGTLGDTASSMGKSLNQTVEMFADAVTGEFERLKEFGVRASVEGDQVTFKWSQNGKDMQVTAEKTASGISGALEGIFARFQGGMEKQSKSMDGLWSNFMDNITATQKVVMDAGIADEIKNQIQIVNSELTVWVKTNEDLIKQNIPVYIDKTKVAVAGVFDALSNVKSIYDAVPSEIMGPAGVGIVGAILFGGPTGKLLGMMAAVNQGMSALDNDLFDLYGKYQKAASGIQNFFDSIKDAASGKRNWWTGAWTEKEVDASRHAAARLKNYDSPVLPNNTEPVAAKEVAATTTGTVTASTKEYNAALSDLKDEHAKLTLSAKAYEDLKVHEWYEKEKAALGGTNAQLQETLRLKLERNRQEQAYKDMQAATEANYKTSMAAVYDDIDIEGPKYAAEDYKKKTELHQQFLADYDRATLSSFDIERKALTDKLKMYEGNEKDIDAVKKWYAEESKRITKDETEHAKAEAEKLAKANRSVWDDISEATIAGTSNLSASFNEILWKSGRTFEDIKIGFYKMLTQMVIQKSAVEPLLSFSTSALKSAGSWFSSLWNAHGNAFDLSGIKAYAHGGTFTNKIVDQPTMFAHGGGIGIMGELGKNHPEGIFPLARTRSGDLGVQAVGGGESSPVNIRIEVINNTGSDTQATTQEPRWDGAGWVCSVILDKVSRSRAYKNSLSAALGRA